MRILAEGTKTYPDDPARHFGFGRFAERAGDIWLAAGHFDFETVRSLAGERIVYLDLEEPNRFFSPDPAFNRQAYEDAFHHVYTLCPYTAAWLNGRQGSPRRTPVFFPFNERFIPERSEKAFDVIYTGHLVAPAVSRLVDAIAPFNYRLVSQSDDPRVTDRSASYVQKLDLIARSRVTVVQNLLFLRPGHVKAVKATEGWEENEAFADIVRAIEAGDEATVEEVVAPQIKSRVFEAAFCRSLILCRRDRWNVIERFFEPGEEFVYYEEGKLTETLQGILADFGAFHAVIDRAFERAGAEYTTEAFVEQYLSRIA
jgi:hypothetical protein